MKKLVCILMAICMLVLVTGCGGTKPAEETAEQTAQRSEFDNTLKNLFANPTTYTFSKSIYDNDKINEDELVNSLAEFVGCEIDLIASESLFTDGDYTAYDTVFVVEFESGERRIYHDVIIANAKDGKPKIAIQTYFGNDEQQKFITKIAEYKKAMATFEKEAIKGFADESKSFASWYDKRKASLEIAKSPLSFTEEVIKLLSPAEVDNRVLTWSEEFDCTSFSQTKLNVTTYQPNAATRATTDDSNLVFKDGTCAIVSRREPAGSKYFYSTFKGFSTIDKMNYAGGYLELRAKFSYERGTWPAFWLMPQSDSKSVQYSVEIDILEVFGEEKVFHTSLHKWPKTGDNSLHEGTSIAAYTFDTNELANDWHTYGFEWTDTHYNFFVDGRCFSSVDLNSPTLLSKNYPGADGYSQPHYVMFGGGPIPPVFDKLTPAQRLTENDTKDIVHTFDYLRLYQNPEKDKLILFN